jgi:hypothetical protein
MQFSPYSIAAAVNPDGAVDGATQDFTMTYVGVTLVALCFVVVVIIVWRRQRLNLALHTQAAGKSAIFSGGGRGSSVQMTGVAARAATNESDVSADADAEASAAAVSARRLSRSRLAASGRRSSRARSRSMSRKADASDVVAD